MPHTNTAPLANFHLNRDYSRRSGYSFGTASHARRNEIAFEISRFIIWGSPEFDAHLVLANIAATDHQEREFFNWTCKFFGISPIPAPSETGVDRRK